MITVNNWQTPRYKTGWRDIWALLPSYLSDGTNGCLTYYIDGLVEQSAARIDWVLGDLLTSLCSNKELLQQQSRALSEQLGQPLQRRLPLLLTKDFCLVPVKARQPLSRNHAADGYVVYAMVEEIKQNPDGAGSLILLKNGQELLVLDKLRTLRDNLRTTAQLMELL